VTVSTQNDEVSEMLVTVAACLIGFSSRRYLEANSHGRQMAVPLVLIWLSFLLWAAPLAADSEQGASVVYAARRGWHIDIGFAAEDLAAPLNTIAADLPGVRYLFFGFGDKHYLLAKNHHAPQMLAALWPGSGIMLVTGLMGTPDAAFGAESVVTLRLSAEQMRVLQSFIWKSFLSENDTLNVYQNGQYENSLYFLATSNYSAFHTCNTWGAEALHMSGLPIHSTGVIFAGQLWSQVEREGRRSQAATSGASLPPGVQTPHSAQTPPAQ
jgi:Protein of unknown function (DUF2459)